MIEVLRPLEPEQLALSLGAHLRTVGTVATHVIGARARSFYLLVGEDNEISIMLGSQGLPGNQL